MSLHTPKLVERSSIFYYFSLRILINLFIYSFCNLFSAITLTLSTTCVFDISSKYLRQSKNSESRPQRNNYVIMNTYNSKIGEIYKASVVTVPQSQNSKMEISTKMVQERSAIFEEFAKNRGRGYSLRGILNSLKSLT